MTTHPDRDLAGLCERLLFNGRYAHETEDQATARRIETRREAAAAIERLVADNERMRERLAKWEPATTTGPVGSTFEPFRQPYSHQQTSDASQIWRETSSVSRTALEGVSDDR